MKKLILIIAIAVIATGCNLQNYRAKKCQKWGVCGTDSITVITKDSVVHDSVVVPESTMWMELSFLCDSSRNVMIKSIDSLNSVNSNLQMKLKDGKLTVYVEVPKTVIQTDTIFKDKYVYKDRTKEVPVELSWLQKTLIIIGIIAIIAVILLIINKLRKII